MIEKSSKDRHFNPEEKGKIEVLSSFSCDSCTRGSEKYNDVFDSGCCVGCGAPVKEFESTLTEVGLDTLNKSILVLASDDASNYSDDIRTTLETEGINTISSQEIIEGSVASMSTANLAFVLKNSLHTFVVPSEKFQSDTALNIALNTALFQKTKGEEISIVPIYTSYESTTKTPMFLRDFMGCDWTGDSKVSPFSSSKERLVSQIKNQISQIDSQ